jgi:hypothetical protein
MTWQKDWHNRFVGKRLIVLGTGPSLLEMEPYIDNLAGEFTFGVNHLYKWEPIRRIPMSFYGASEYDRIPAMTNPQRALRYPETTRRFAATLSPLNGDAKANWWWVQKSGDHPMYDGWFQGLGETLPWVAQGFSVVPDVALQVGCWMGFSEFLLAGCDFTATGEVWDGAEQRDPDNTALARRSMEVAINTISDSGRKISAITHTDLQISYINPLSLFL